MQFRIRMISLLGLVVLAACQRPPSPAPDAPPEPQAAQGTATP